MKLCNECWKPVQYHGNQCPVCSHKTKKLNGHLAFAPELAEQNEGFEADYFARLADLEAENFWFRSRNRLITWALGRYFPTAKTFLEIGCGTGFVLSGIRQAFPELVLSGSEIFIYGLRFAAKRVPGAELFQMDARRIPFAEEFDVIGAFDVLEHVKQDDDVLAQMHQATRKNGGILITVPHHRFLWSPVDEFARHVRRYATRELKEKVTRAGFSIVRTTSFVTLPLPLMIASRFKQRVTGRAVDPSAEYNISDVVNTTLEKVLNAERTAIRAGLSFPLGGSLFLAARRK